jgi:hypothetical protein
MVSFFLVPLLVVLLILWAIVRGLLRLLPSSKAARLAKVEDLKRRREAAVALEREEASSRARQERQHVEEETTLRAERETDYNAASWHIWRKGEPYDRDSAYAAFLHRERLERGLSSEPPAIAEINCPACGKAFPAALAHCWHCSSINEASSAAPAP